MKKDILKEFVSENRHDFDDQEPGSDVLSKIQSRLGMEPPVAAPRAKTVRLQYWWAAAAILVIIAGIMVLSQPEKIAAPPVAIKTEPGPVTSPVHSEKKDSITSVPPMIADIPDTRQKNAVVKRPRRMVEEKVNAPVGSGEETVASHTAANDWKKELQSESSSARLAAVLASGKSNTLSGSDLQLLSNTMNNDENSNVRLAALDILKKQDNQEAVKELILQSVAKQDDPVVQMELLASLSSDQASNIKKQLLEITQNPINIDAVRNEAYAALLRSESNF
ncbi:HEAT repeat domain-containing protein [Niabella pedocola]|uniref:HEAT repeat domain-containing protein n=1 Tax=Niabella pedocola TaxID=1752077 RepID=A0ABS8PUN7_9BACT|nr:HEAT repeat domain-containing protein [Niabella pedocola]MCD2424783.1 HEAT repeat domain-containing protein [Niabella pedocola]